MSKCYLNKQGWRVRTWKSCILYELHLTKFTCICLGVLGFFRCILVYWEYRIALTWNVNSTVEEGRKKNALIKWIVGFLIFFHINATDFCKEGLSIFRGAWRMRSLPIPPPPTPEKWREGGKLLYSSFEHWCLAVVWCCSHCGSSASFLLLFKEHYGTTVSVKSWNCFYSWSVLEHLVFFTTHVFHYFCGLMNSLTETLSWCSIVMEERITPLWPPYLTGILFYSNFR